MVGVDGGRNGVFVGKRRCWDGGIEGWGRVLGVRGEKVGVSDGGVEGGE